VAEPEWQRLDARMLLVHPVSELIRFLPVLIGIFLASSATDRGTAFQLLGIAIPIAIGLVRYWTTRYRISGTRIELERGLVSRHAVATPLDRVRTVDLTASPIHRLLGLSTVRIGTGSASEEGLDLDGLATERARALRERLLRSIAAPVDVEDEAHPTGVRLVARFEPRWLRYAPFTSAGLVLTAGVLGVGSQVLDGLGVFEDLDGEAIDRRITEIGAFLALPALVVGVLVTGAVVSLVGYVVANGNFTLSHTLPDGSWHLRRGLLTIRETSVDDDRMRGVSIGEPLGLRMVGGGRLAAIVTGLDRKQTGSETLLPPTPRPLVDRVAADVVGTTSPVLAPLRPHGPRARTRRHVRALVPLGLVAAGLTAVVLVLDWPAWALSLPPLLLVAAVGLGHDRTRGLGHALVEGWLVARSGSLTRKRELLATDAIIGWNLRATWFQRRAGLATLVATTAGGPQSVTVLDVPEADAVALADAAVPGLVGQFLVPDRDPPPARGRS
jgi:putative membrane protein